MSEAPKPMDYKFEEIFSHDRIKKHVKDGGKAEIDHINGKLVITLWESGFVKEIIQVHELNDVHDFTEHSYNNFRRTKLEKEIEIYDDISLTGDKLNQLYCTTNLTTEAAELNQIIIRDLFFNKKINPTHLSSELSDIKWYFVMIAKLFGFSIGQILRVNIIKLKIRYPNKNIKLANKNEELENTEIKKYLQAS